LIPQAVLERFAGAGEGEIDIRTLGAHFRLTEEAHPGIFSSHHPGELCDGRSGGVVRDPCYSVYSCTSLRACTGGFQNKSNAIKAMLPEFRARHIRAVRSQRLSWSYRTGSDDIPDMRGGPNEVHVAVHVARAGLRPGHPRFVHPRVYSHLFRKIRDNLTEARVFFHVFGEGLPGAYPELRYLPFTTVHLRAPITKADQVVMGYEVSLRRTFDAFVHAQVIVVARSAFSYAAALLSTGKVYQIVDPLFPAMDHWVKVNAMQ